MTSGRWDSNGLPVWAGWAVGRGLESSGSTPLKEITHFILLSLLSMTGGKRERMELDERPSKGGKGLTTPSFVGFAPFPPLADDFSHYGFVTPYVRPARDIICDTTLTRLVTQENLGQRWTHCSHPRQASTTFCKIHLGPLFSCAHSSASSDPRLFSRRFTIFPATKYPPAGTNANA